MPATGTDILSSAYQELATTTSALESWLPQANSEKSTRQPCDFLEKLSPTLKQFVKEPLKTNSEKTKKFIQILDKLRAICAKALPSTLSSQNSRIIQDILGDVLIILTTNKHLFPSDKDSMNILESLLMISKYKIEPADRSDRDVDATWQFLDLCLQFAGIKASTTSNSLTNQTNQLPVASAPKQILSFNTPKPSFRVVRCVASAYYNSGAVLYNASLSQVAKRFFERSVDILDLLVNHPNFQPQPQTQHEQKQKPAQRNASSSSLSSGDATAEQIHNVRRQITDRRALLSSVYHSVGEFRLAHESYLSAILGVNLVPSQVIEQQKGLPSDFWRWIDKFTRIGCFDLLLESSENSLVPSFEQRLPLQSVSKILDAQINSIKRGANPSERDVSFRHLGGLIRQSIHLWTGKSKLQHSIALTRLLEHIITIEEIIFDSVPENCNGLMEQIIFLTNVDNMVLPSDPTKAARTKASAFSVCAIGHIWICIRSRRLGHVKELVHHAKCAIDNAKTAISISKSGTERLTALNPLANMLGAMGLTEMKTSVLELLEQLDLPSTNDSPASNQVINLLKRSELLALSGDNEKSAATYMNAVELHKNIQIQQSSPSTQRLIEKCRQIQRTAVANSSFSTIQECSGSLTSAIKAASHAARLFHRAMSYLSRLSVLPLDSTTSDNVASFFAPQQNSNSNSNSKQNSKRKQQISGSQADSLMWQLSQSLLFINIRLTSLYILRGSIKPATFFAQQSLDLAEDLGGGHATARPLLLQAEIDTLAGKYDNAKSNLSKILEIIVEDSIFIHTEVNRLHGELCLEIQDFLNADKYFLAAQNMLDKIELRQPQAKPEEERPATSRASSRSTKSRVVSKATPKPGPKMLKNQLHREESVDGLQISLIQRRAFAQAMAGDNENASKILQKLDSVLLSDKSKAYGNVLEAKLSLDKLKDQFKLDPVFSLLQDSSLSIPPGAIVNSREKQTKEKKLVISQTTETEKLYKSAFSLCAGKLRPFECREIGMSLAACQSYLANLGKPDEALSTDLSHILETTVDITLRRELIEATEKKLEPSVEPNRDDLTWPVLQHNQQNSTNAEESFESEQERQDLNTDQLLQYWSNIHKRHFSFEKSTLGEDQDLDKSISDLLPRPDWNVISIHLSTDKESLFISRYDKDQQDPLVFRLLLDRLDKREGEDEDAFTFDLARESLKEIIAANNRGTKRAKDIKKVKDRSNWWKERHELDAQMNELLQNIEHRWLGGFKAVFSSPKRHSKKKLDLFRKKLEQILRKSFFPYQGKAPKAKLHDIVINCFSLLDPETCVDEDVEDLIQFAMEAFQLKDCAVECDELDLTQLTFDIRGALKEFHRQDNDNETDSHMQQSPHLFLIIDDSLQQFPWESIPILRGKSISRIPSMAFLKDKLSLIDVWPRQELSEDERNENVLVGDGKKVFYVLNPAGDLRRTQQEFQESLEKNIDKGWKGMTGRTPSEMEIEQSLKSNDVFLYFGHNGAEQYIRGQCIKYIPRCAATFLWGCSSGVLSETGKFGPTGTPWNYMTAGCPCMVATLWDVTDRDIDRMSMATLESLGLLEGKGDSNHLNVPEAIAAARETCTMKYLNGAAPVVYGVPTCFRS